MYAKRDQAFAKWLEEDCELPLPKEPQALEIAELALREAFNAGWAARKLEQYKGSLN